MGSATAGVLAAMLAVVLVACGDDREPVATSTIPDRPARPDRLPRDQQREVYGYQNAISAYCRELTIALRSRTPPPPAHERRRALRAANRLAELAAARPFDLVQIGVDVRLFTGDLIEDLSTLDCDPEILRALEAGLG